MSLRNPFIAAFTLTASILLPAGYHELGAGPPQTAQLVRPGTATIAVDGAAITVSADKALVESGGLVKVKLAANSAKPSRVKVAILVEEAQGSGGSRVESPPDTVADEMVELEARPGGGPAREVAFKLRGHRAANMDGLAPYGYYTILVMQPAEAKKFEKLLRKAQPDDGSEFWSMWYRYQGGDGGDGDAASADVARLEVRTSDYDPAFKIIAPEKVRAGEKFTVVVEMKNRDQEDMTDPTIQLSTPSLGADYLGIEDGQIEIVGEGKIDGAIKHGQKGRVEFQVTAKTTGLLGLYASNWSEDHGHANALGAVEVLPADNTVAHQ